MLVCCCAHGCIVLFDGIRSADQVWYIDGDAVLIICVHFSSLLGSFLLIALFRFFFIIISWLFVYFDSQRLCITTL
jgi:hypothetical protein